jgi:hypothetical protein
VDEAYLAKLYDDFNKKEFGGALPPCRLVFKDQDVVNGKVPEGMLHPMEHMRSDPDSGEIWVAAPFFKDREYEKYQDDIDQTLKHEMCHAEFHRQGKPWRHGEVDHDAFNELADRVGAHREPDSWAKK